MRVEVVSRIQPLEAKIVFLFSSTSCLTEFCVAVTFSGKFAFYVAFQKKREKSHLDDHRVAEVAQKREGPLSKSLNSDENFKPWHMLFCCDCDIKIYCDLHAI